MTDTKTHTTSTSTSTIRKLSWRLPLGFAVFKILLHLPFLHRFGIHHDELYFLACGRHLSLGYVDHPPFVPLIARLAEELAGGGPFLLQAMRLPAVLAGAASLAMMLLLVQRLGGGSFAQWLAGLATLAAPVFLRMNQMLNIPSFEPLVWLGVAHILVTLLLLQPSESAAKLSTSRLVSAPGLWLAIGALCGVGLWIKHSTLFLGFGLAVAIVATPHRRHLRTPWPWLGGALALLLVSPQLAWQAANGWPTVEFLSRLNDGVMASISKLQFALGQLLYFNPVTAVVWIAGLVVCFRRPADSVERFLGWIWIGVFGLLFLIDSKIYYTAPAYPAIFAIGAVAWERWTRAWSPKRRWLRPVLLVNLLLGFVLMVPLSLPILSIDSTERFIRGISFGAFDNVYELTADLRGQFGWQERTEGVARVWNALDDEEREKAVLLGDWYGPAGAIDLYGPELGLPAAYSTHLSYHLWRTPPADTEIFVVAGENPDDLREFFEDVEVAETVDVPEGNPWDRNFPISIARRPKVNVEEVWPALREY